MGFRTRDQIKAHSQMLSAISLLVSKYLKNHIKLVPTNINNPLPLCSLNIDTLPNLLYIKN